MSDCSICGCEFKTCKRCADETIKNLTICQCSEMDAEFGIHCNSCVKDKIEKLQAELDENKTIAMDAVRTSHELQQQLAERDETIEKLQAELAERDERISNMSKAVRSCEAENMKLLACVEFYADKENWWCPIEDNSFQIRIMDNDYEYTHYYNVGGKRARKCLAEINSKTGEK